MKKQNYEIKKIKREKIEQLLFSFIRWEENFSLICLQYSMYFNNKLRQDELLEMIKVQDKDLPDLVKKFKVLITLYFPELENKYKEIEESKSKIAPFLAFSNYKKNENFDKLVNEFGKITEEFKVLVAKESEKLF